MSFDNLFEFFPSHRIAFIYLSTFVTLPSVLLYVAQIVTVLRHKQLHNSFYALFVARALADLLHTLNSYFDFKLPVAFGNVLFGTYSQLPNWLLKMSIFASIYSFQAINLATVFVSLNRLSAVLAPFSHEKLWKVALLPVAIFVIFVLPFLPLFFVLKMVVTLAQVEQASSTSFQLGENRLETNFAPLVGDICAVIAALSLISCLLINFGTLMAYKRRSANAQDSLGESQRTERKLALYMVYTFAGHMTVSALMTGMSLLNHMGFTAADLLYSEYMCVMDWCTVVLSSWLLLWASSLFRKQMITDLAPKWLKKRLISSSSSIRNISDQKCPQNGAVTNIKVTPINAKVTLIGRQSAADALGHQMKLERR